VGKSEKEIGGGEKEREAGWQVHISLYGQSAVFAWLAVIQSAKWKDRNGLRFGGFELRALFITQLATCRYLLACVLLFCILYDDEGRN
jgi:hypothetical protein